MKLMSIMILVIVLRWQVLITSVVIMLKITRDHPLSVISRYMKLRKFYAISSKIA